MCSQTGFEYDKKSIDIKSAKAAIFDVSRNGVYISHISVGDNLKYRAVVLKVGKKNVNDSSQQPETGDSKSGGNENADVLQKVERVNHKDTSLNASYKLELTEISLFQYDYEAKLQKEGDNIIDPKEYIKWKVLNSGHIIGLSLRLRKLFVDDVE